MKDEVLTNIEAAALLRVHRKRLCYWRRRGIGPPFVQVGRIVRYSAAALRRWAEQWPNGPPRQKAPAANVEGRDARRFTDPPAWQCNELTLPYRERQRRARERERLFARGWGKLHSPVLGPLPPEWNKLRAARQAQGG